ncbi:MAG TPA: hypothetical protein VNZ26_04345 [Vicinamibacterales bacterium]|jgi:hypothetical protein|nr:hypothetical protein [Vicinamibacterales bacterium]
MPLNMKMSIVDTSPVLAGATAVEAFRTTSRRIMRGYVDRPRSYELIADACLPGHSAQVENTPEDALPTAGVVREP